MIGIIEMVQSQHFWIQRILKKLKVEITFSLEIDPKISAKLIDKYLR